MTQPASPHTAADASALWLLPSPIVTVAAAGCALRRFFESGAHTTRHDIAQSSGIEHVLWIVNETLASA
jgi:hypothetical protein